MNIESRLIELIGESGKKLILHVQEMTKLLQILRCG